MTDEIAAIAALDEPVRKALYDAVRTSGRPMTREEAAAATRISRKLAAFHLDKLVSVGLLVAGTASGPRQVGRAPKAYHARADAVQLSIPPRAYVDLASILIEAVDEQAEAEPMEAACRRVAARRGETVGKAVASRRGSASARVREALAAAGYEPYDGPDESLRLRNCPFHPLADDHPEFVCGVNGAFLAGVLAGTRASALEVVPQPPAGQCCAEIKSRVRDNSPHDR